MAKLSQIFPDKEVIVPMESGEQITMWVNINAVTFEAYDAMQKKIEKGSKGDNNATKEVLEMFCVFVKDWDVEYDEGGKVPLDADTIYKTFGPVGSMPIMDAFTKAVNPTVGE